MTVRVGDRGEGEASGERTSSEKGESVRRLFGRAGSPMLPPTRGWRVSMPTQKLWKLTPYSLAGTGRACGLVPGPGGGACG